MRGRRAKKNMRKHDDTMVADYTVADLIPTVGAAEVPVSEAASTVKDHATTEAVVEPPAPPVSDRAPVGIAEEQGAAEVEVSPELLQQLLGGETPEAAMTVESTQANGPAAPPPAPKRKADKPSQKGIDTAKRVQTAIMGETMVSGALNFIAKFCGSGITVDTFSQNRVDRLIAKAQEKQVPLPLLPNGVPFDIDFDVVNGLTQGPPLPQTMYVVIAVKDGKPYAKRYGAGVPTLETGEVVVNGVADMKTENDVCINVESANIVHAALYNLAAHPDAAINWLVEQAKVHQEKIRGAYAAVMIGGFVFTCIMDGMKQKKTGDA